MPDTIDVRGLDDQDIALLQHLADTLRSRAKSGRKADKVTEPGEVLVFATHHSDVIGPLTREEIYEDL